MSEHAAQAPAAVAASRKRASESHALEATAATAVRQADAAACVPPPPMADEPPSKRAKVVQPASMLSSVSAAAAATSAACAGDSSSASSIAAPSAVTPSLSIAQRCNRDCLSIIFSFCEGVRVVASAAQTCRSWRATALLRQSSCRAKVDLDHFFDRRATSLQMLQSPLRVHLARLEFGNARDVDLLQLQCLHARCPQLEELTIEMDDTSSHELTESVEGATMFNTFAWPSSLRSLEIGRCGFNEKSIGLQPLLNALPSSAIRLGSLTLAIADDDDVTAVLDLAPLVPLREFASLCTYYSPSVSQLAVVRQLRNLTELDVAGGYWEREDLLALLADGTHQLQRLEKINIRGVTLDVELMQALLTLPNLTELEPSRIHSSCFPLLRSFEKLRKLCLYPRAVNAAAVVELLSSLRALSELTCLRLDGFAAESAVQKALLNGLSASVPQLRELRLRYFCELPPLNALISCTQLRRLRLTKCERERGQPLADILELILSLPSLESVEVHRCRLPLTDEQCMQFAPPSILAPSLKTFDWRSRR
jgi:hypothetical protein